MLLALSIIASEATRIDCIFKSYGVDGYNCQVQKLHIDQPATDITDVSGNHLKGKTNDDVQVFYIPSSNCIQFLPTNVSQVFKHIEKYEVAEGRVVSISENDFRDFAFLRTLEIRKNPLSMILDGTFRSLSRLETLILSDNRIRRLESRTLEKLSSLKKLFLTGNLLETLPSGLFANNLLLEEIDLSFNRLRAIEPEILSPLKLLKAIQLEGNFCTSQSFFGKIPLDKLRDEFASKCIGKAELVESSKLTEMRHDTIMCQRNASLSHEKAKLQEETLAKSSVKIDELTEEKLVLASAVSLCHGNLSAHEMEILKLKLKLQQAETLNKDLESRIAELDLQFSNYQSIVDDAVNLQNATANELQAAKSHNELVKVVVMISSLFIIIALVTYIAACFISKKREKAKKQSSVPMPTFKNVWLNQ